MATIHQVRVLGLLIAVLWLIGGSYTPVKHLSFKTHTLQSMCTQDWKVLTLILSLERRAPAESAYETNTLRKMAPPARAPPPKMRDLFVPPSATPAGDYYGENVRCASSASSNGSGSVRHITPEDVYDDRERMSYAQYSTMESEQDTPKQRAPQRTQYIPSADSRYVNIPYSSPLPHH